MSLCAAAGLLSACAGDTSAPDEITAPAPPDVRTEQIISPDATYALQQGSLLDQISVAASREAAATAATGFQIAAAESDVRAIRAERFPRLAPVASVDEDGRSVVGLSVVQPIYDFGDRGARIDAAEYDVELAQIDHLIALNEATFDALNAYLDYLESEQLLAVRRDLQDELGQLAATINERFAGGVSNRSEALEIQLVQQELAREIFEETTTEQTAADRLDALLGANARVAFTGADLGPIVAACRIGEVPNDALLLQRARLGVSKALAERAELRARRWPALISNLGVNYVEGEQQSAATLSLDATNLLGWERFSANDAAQSRINAARLAYTTAAQELRDDSDRFTLEYRRAILSLTSLDALSEGARENEALFEDLFESGLVAIDEAIQLKRENARLQEQRVGIELNALRVCVRLGRIHGSLVSGGETS